MDHSRRQFVGQCAAVASTSAVSAMMGRIPAEAAQTPPLRNWAGNYQYSTTSLTSGRSLAEVQDFVRTLLGHDQIDVNGAGRRTRRRGATPEVPGATTHAVIRRGGRKELTRVRFSC